MENKLKQFGFIPDVPKPEDYILGGFTKVEGVVLRPDGQWLNRLPVIEEQKRYGVESMSCVSFATLNIVEMLLKELFDAEANYSDRYLSSMAETTPQGNSPSKVADVLRKEAGCVDEVDLPFTDQIKSFADYIIPKNLIPKPLIKKGEEWKSKYDLKYEIVFSGGENKQEKLKEALKYSPVGVSVLAWRMENGLYVKPKGVQDNHYTLLVGYEEGKRFIVFDSYSESEGDLLKDLAWDYDFGMAKVYYLRNIEKEMSFLEQLIKKIAELISSLSLLVQKKVETPPEPIPEPTPEPQPEPQPITEQPKSKIKEWALAIQKEEGFFEGSKSKRNNNPGNLKYSSLPASLGAIGKDAGNFCIFKDYNSGFNALCEFLTLAAEDKLKPYRNARTLYTFTKVYAEPPDDNYAKNVARALGVSILTPIKELL